MANQRSRTRYFDFLGHCKPPAVASDVSTSSWCSKITSAGAGATLISVAGGIALALEATSEVQNVCLYMGDILSFLPANLQRVEFWASVSDSLAAAVTASFGLATARNDAIASITDKLLFQCVGNNTLAVTAGDGTNTVAAVSTGLTFGSTKRRFVMDFAEGVKSNVGSLSKGGSANVILSVENDYGLQRVIPGTPVDLSNYTGGYQLFAQIQKTVGTAVGTLTIEGIEVTYRQ